MSGNYGIKEIFLTLQGEGHRAGTKAVFLRFSGCNLWTGKPTHRGQGDGACARWCDTDFAKGSVMTAQAILAELERLWPANVDPGERWCVLTGGEPLLQLNVELAKLLKTNGWFLAVETNGTVECDALAWLDWVCIAPKLATDGKTPLDTVAGVAADELKFVLPGAMPGEPGWSTEALEMVAARYPTAHRFVQPQDPLVSPDFVEQTALKRTVDTDEETDAALDAQFSRSLQRCIVHVLSHPKWRLSTQMHKAVGVR